MKHISILVPDSQTTPSTIACIAGAYEIFTEAEAFWQQGGHVAQFKIEMVSATRKTQSDSIFSVKAHTTADELTKTHLILIPSSLVRSYDTATRSNQSLITWVAMQHAKGAEVASMCTGAFMLAATGLLEGMTCSTHWAVSERFAGLYPDVKLQTERLITDENGIYTNGGAYSFLHLLLYLVEKHYNRQIAVRCAKIFQIDMDRSMQAEFSIFTGQKQHDDELVLKAQAYIERHYRQPLSIGALSDKLHVGRRNFDRRFIRATGLTPLDYLQRVRTEAAKRAFETTRKTVNEVMYSVGYSDARAFREVFQRITGLSPADYKAKYNRQAA
ncbi:MAG: helix-turn-helix domain-containing protein [Bacteroidetes bacterium]|nr:helix-turn-helix domain-containing protein [Bacteroidota bacterium]